MTEIGLTDGYRLEAYVIASDATGSGRPLLAPGKDQLADVGKGALMVSLLILFLEIKETQCNHVFFFLLIERITDFCVFIWAIPVVTLILHVTDIATYYNKM
jgi:hypothetical protein